MKQTLKRIDLSRVARFLVLGWQRPDLAQRGGGHRGVPFPLCVLLLSVLSPRNETRLGGAFCATSRLTIFLPPCFCLLSNQP